MDIMEVISNRHSVRSYTNDKIEEAKLIELRKEMDSCNADSGLHLQLISDEPNAFTGIMARYGRLINVKNYIAMIGEKSDDLDEKIGYYGERLVLKAQQIGLNSCWVGATFSKSKAKKKVIIGKEDKLVCVIAIGYGTSQGAAHKSKRVEELSNITDAAPEWFKMGMRAVELAPTALNQQKIYFKLDGDKVSVEVKPGFYVNVDLGIVKYHFEQGAGISNFIWV